MMNNNTYLLFFFLLFTIPFSAAQVSLPYSTDFEVADQSDWTEYRTGLAHSFHWNFSSNSPFILRHDYPVGNMSGETVRDWMVSPAISFPGTSKLDLRALVFTFSNVVDSDYFGIWFSAGSPDPADGDYVEIVDLTNFTPDDEWRDTTGIEIPYTAANGYVAFRFETIDNWFTLSIDSLHIKADNIVSNQDIGDFSNSITLFPNPAIDGFSIKTTLAQAGVLEINLLDAHGQFIQQIENAAFASGVYQKNFLLPNLVPGFYLVDIVVSGRHTIKKLVWMK